MSRTNSFLQAILMALFLFSCSRKSETTVICMIGGSDPGVIDGPRACLWCKVKSNAEWAEKVGNLDFAMDLKLKTVPMGFIIDGDTSFSLKYEEKEVTLKMKARPGSGKKVYMGREFYLLWRREGNDLWPWPDDLNLDSLDLALKRTTIHIEGVSDTLKVDSVRITNCSEFHAWLNG